MNKKFSIALQSALAATLLMAAPVAFADNYENTQDSTRDGYRSLRNEVRNDVEGVKIDAQNKMGEIKSDARNDIRDIKSDARDNVNTMRTDVRNEADRMHGMRTSYPDSDTSDNAVRHRIQQSIDSYKDVNVDYSNGEARLTGKVRTTKEKNDVVKRAREITGVNSVTDNITVTSDGSGSVSGYIDDASITTVVKGKFLGQKGLDSLDIGVETTNGVVTLTGQVENQAQIGLAEGVAKEADGVRRVVNHLSPKQ